MTPPFATQSPPPSSPQPAVFDSADASPTTPRQAVQDLKSFRLPQNFRGRPAWVVQLWWIVQASLFRMSPQVLYGWRRFLLRLFGCSVGKGVLVRPTAEITYPWKVSIGDYSWIGHDVTLYSLGEIHIGANVVVSQGSYLCAAAHDMEKPSFDIYEDPVVIEDEAWVAADVFVAPGVRIGHGAVVGARSTVLHDLPPMMVSFGNPAKPVRLRFTPKLNS
jgi:putative colanic acid biosynthesis acetyltransferase WcaF